MSKSNSPPARPADRSPNEPSNRPASRTNSASGTAPAKKSGNQPVHTIRYRNLKGTIWRNSGAKGDFYSVTLSRSYQDDQEQWHDVTSFNFNDLPTLAKIAHDCHSWIAWQERRTAEEQKGRQ